MSEQAIERRAPAPGASRKKAGGASGRRPKQAAATSAKGRGGAAKAAVTKKPAAPKTTEPKKSAAPKTAEPKKATVRKTTKPKKATAPKTAEPKRSNVPKQVKGAEKPAKATARASAARTPSGRKAAKPAARRPKTAKVQANPVAEAANQKNTSERRREKTDDLFLERRVASPSPEAGDGTPPEKGRALFGALNACLAIAIAVVAALGLRLQGQYADFQRMREVVDQQTFYEGTTVEGVDVSKMTLSNAMDYWRTRKQPVGRRNLSPRAKLTRFVVGRRLEAGIDHHLFTHQGHRRQSRHKNHRRQTLFHFTSFECFIFPAQERTRRPQQLRAPKIIS